MSKWVSHHIAVGRMMAFRKARDCNDCPRCGNPHEDTLHVLRCAHINSRKTWRKGVKELCKWMRNRKTDPSLISALGKTLRQFNKPGQFDVYIPKGLRPELKRCFRSQARIGWTGFLEGLLSKEWAAYQERYYKRKHSRRSGTRWAVELSKNLWKLVFTMWDHRNNTLFSQGKIDTLSGIHKVKQAISREREIGIGTLDLSYTPYFSLPTSSFTKMKAINLRRWLSLIRQAREAQGHIYTDEFGTSAALREWIGLTVRPEHLQHHQRRQVQRQQQKELYSIRTGYRD